MRNNDAPYATRDTVLVVALAFRSSFRLFALGLSLPTGFAADRTRRIVRRVTATHSCEYNETTKFSETSWKFHGQGNKIFAWEKNIDVQIQQISTFVASYLANK